MSEKKKQETADSTFSRRRILGKLVWVAPAIVATAAVSARAAEVSGGGGSGGSPGCGP